MGNGFANGATTGGMYVNLPVQMRNYPTLIEFSTLRVFLGGASYPITALTLDADYYSNTMPGLSFTVASGLTSGNILWLGSNNSSSGYLGLGAEL